VVSNSPLGRPQGAEIVIEDLFYNVPARRKFLRSERTERRHIDAFLTRYAIAYPGIAFYVVHDGKEVLSTSGNGVAEEALLAVYGMDLGMSLLAVPPELTAEAPIQVRGFVGPTTVHRADRGYITLFINGRWVEDLRLTYAIIQAYHTLLPGQRFPVAFVMVAMPPEEVDVNVHPAKTEVRFRDGDIVFRAVQRAVRATVVNEAPAAAAWQPPAAPSVDTPFPGDSARARLAALTPAARQISFPEPLPGTMATPAASPETMSVGPLAAPAVRRANLPPLRVIGQTSTMFIIAEGPDGLYLIDQHAAHERVLYEQMLGEWAKGQVYAQPLLEPEVVSLPLDEAARLEEFLPTLHTLGLEVEPFGPGAFLVRSLPAPLGPIPPRDLLADIAASTEDRSPVRAELEEMIVRRICKRAAVKAGQVLSREEMETLIKDLEKTENPRTCPHGRPTIIQISIEQLVRQFGRES
jgi:DNA mismatch repair protein MutL